MSSVSRILLQYVVWVDQLYKLHEYSKNLYSLRTCIIPNEAIIRDLEPWECRANGFWSSGGCWLGIYAISQWVWVVVLLYDMVHVSAYTRGKHRIWWPLDIKLIWPLEEISEMNRTTTERPEHSRSCRSRDMKMLGDWLIPGYRWWYHVRSYF